MDFNSIPFFLEVYVSDRFQEQISVIGVESVLQKIKPLTLKYDNKYDINDLQRPYPVQFMIIDRTYNDKPAIIKFPHELYAWYLYYKEEKKVINNSNNRVLTQNQYDSYSNKKDKTVIKDYYYQAKKDNEFFEMFIDHVKGYISAVLIVLFVGTPIILLVVFLKDLIENIF